LKLAFRRANSADLPFTIELSKRVFSIYGPYDEIIAGWASLPHTVTVVVEEMGQPRGFAMINLAPPAQDQVKSELLAIAIFPEYHGRGMGKRLLRYMENVARSHGVRELFLHTAVINEPARCFFVEHGFTRRDVVDCYYPMGQKALEMSKTLPSGP
jgi:ribosomal protein S18 acetylase RimI-like enzyme